MSYVNLYLRPHDLINIDIISMVQQMELDEKDFDQGQQAIVASASTSMSSMNTIPDGWVVEQVSRRIGDQKDKVIHFLSFKMTNFSLDLEN